MCRHRPHCPPAYATDRDAAHTVASHPEQGWSLLCNGVVVFDDTGELLPDGEVIAPHRHTDAHCGSVPDPKSPRARPRRSSGRRARR
ncbi:hypothetical protein GCM10023195_39600 [Actinoallomurus liliacearum]|uniref:Amidohydrolase 3 domain-containing protein n=1 Tax=Actinoallomurus liliacearum TaxID=1080073 RepID=A0ABP8TME1_9ACTN